MIPPWAMVHVLEPEEHIAHRFKSDPIVQTQSVPERDASNVAANSAPTIAGMKRDIEPTQFVTESLGSQLIEGLYAEGTRTSHTIPAGREGNDRPISIVQEGWVSRELELSIP